MKKPQAPPTVSDINVTPMVDVMLVLLIIFMVITPMLTKGQSVEMYRAKNPIAMKDADKDDAILIAVTRDGKLFMSPGNKQVGNIDDLPGKVKDLLANRTDKVVYIKSDARAKYERVTDVVDAMRVAGVEDIGLITELIPQEGNNTPRRPGATN
jgi:biopolymer transport protein ExbD